MSKRDYEMIAKVIASDSESHAESDFALGLEWMRCRIADKLAQEFERENPNFNREKFLDACDAS